MIIIVIYGEMIEIIEIIVIVKMVVYLNEVGYVII